MDDESREARELNDNEELMEEDTIEVDQIDDEEPAEKLSKANVRRRIEDYFEEKRILDSIDYVIDKHYKSELDDIYKVDNIPINEPFFD